MTATQPAWPPFVCPEHQSVLEIRADVLACHRGHTFARRGGIPRFVSGEDYAAPFGQQWKRFRLTQLDSHTHVPISRDRLRRCLGEEVWKTLPSAHVLECGCGAGRFTEVLLDEGAFVTSIDLSEAVEANWENFPDPDRHRIAQADIRALPFRDEAFDIVLCLGVVQHLPNSEQAIQLLFQKVRVGGWCVIDHYARDWKWYTTAKPIYRFVLRRVSSERGMRWTSRLVRSLLPVHKAARRFRPAQVILGRISPVYHYYHVYPQFSDELQYEWALLDTHDALTDRYKHRRSRAEVHQTLAALGATDIWCEYGGNGVEARARKPARV